MTNRAQPISRKLNTYSPNRINKTKNQGKTQDGAYGTAWQYPVPSTIFTPRSDRSLPDVLLPSRIQIRHEKINLVMDGRIIMVITDQRRRVALRILISGVAALGPSHPHLHSLPTNLLTRPSSPRPVDSTSPVCFHLCDPCSLGSRTCRFFASACFF